MPVTYTTILPDAQQPSLGNGVEDEVAVTLEDVTNNGDYRIQIRETGQSAWDETALGFDEVILASDGDTSGSVDTVFTGREDGEEYEVRARTETEHVEGDWTQPESIITQFPGAADLQLDPDDSVTPTSVPLVWVDQSDNELGHDVERRRRYDSGWGPWRTQFELDANTESHVDDTALPGREYEYRIRAYTDDTQAYSNTVAASTPDLDAPNESIPARGWYIELDHPSGTTVSPRVVDDPSRNPQVNGLPGLQIPVPRDDKWTAFTDQPVRVWADGRQQPIDELIRVEQSPEESVLVAEGATELRQTVQRDVVEERADTFIEDLLGEETGYESVVDEPTGTREEDVPQLAATTESDYEALLADPPSETDPARITSDGTVEELATLDIAVAGASLDGGDPETDESEPDSSAWINNQVLGFNDTDLNAFVEARSLGVEYDIPDGDVGVALYIQTPDVHHMGFDVVLDGDVIESYPADYFFEDEQIAPEWLELEGISGSLAAGDHTLRVEATAFPDASDSDRRVWVNAAIIYQQSYYDFLGTNVLGGWGYGPRTHAAEYEAEFADVTPAQSVVGGRLDIDISSTEGQQSVGLSNDSGASWTTAGNTTSLDVDWAEAAPSLRPRVTLSSHDVDNEEMMFTEQTGHELDVVDVYADLQDIPVLVNEPYDASLEEIMTEVAEATDSVWQARIMGGEYVVEWTQPGQRPLELAADLIDYSYSEDVSRMVEHARVFGAAREYSETLTVEHDTEVELTHSPVVSASETIENPDSGEVHEHGADYVARNNAGTIEALSAGDLSDGQEVEVSYEYNLFGEYTKSGVEDPRSERYDVNIPTDRGCGQAALYLVEQLGEPVVEADITVPKQALGWDAINALTVPELPGERHQVKSIEETPQEIRATLESRESVGEVVSDLRREVTGNTRRS